MMVSINCYVVAEIHTYSAQHGHLSLSTAFRPLGRSCDNIAESESLGESPRIKRRSRRGKYRQIRSKRNPQQIMTNIRHNLFNGFLNNRYVSFSPEK